MLGLRCLSDCGPGKSQWWQMIYLKVMRWFYLRQVMLTRATLHADLSCLRLFLHPNLLHWSHVQIPRQMGWTAGFQFTSSSSCPLEKLRKSLVSPHWAVCAHLQIVLSSHLEPSPAQSTVALPCQKGPQCLLSQHPMASAPASPATCMHEQGQSVHTRT